MFCQLELLRQCFPPSVRRILEELPDSLDETYERILREIMKPNQEHARRLLQCLVVAVRPLRVEELAEVLAFDFNTEGMPKLNTGWRWEDQEEAVTLACSSLVTIVKDGDARVVQFSHFFRQGIFDGRPACGSHPGYHALSHSTRSCACDSCISMPWCSPPIGRSR